MNSKKIFSWSKRQSSAETYRTGGLVSIDTSPSDSSNGFEKVTTETRRRRPSDLRIIPPDNKSFNLSPLSAPYSAVLVHAASNLQAVFNDILHSPAPSAAACTRPASIHKPLPGRPRSMSLPSTPELPAELAGSILQENQGFPSSVAVEGPTLVGLTSQICRISTHPPKRSVEKGNESIHLVGLFPEPLNHAKSVPNLAHRHSDMRSVRSGNALNAAAKPSPLKVQHKKSLSDSSSRRRSRHNLVTSPSSTDSKLATCLTPTAENSSDKSARARVGASKLLQPSPLIVEGQTWTRDIEHPEGRRNELNATSTSTSKTTRSRQIEELKATITTQDQTISTLQAQFASLRVSHEAHVASLTDLHSAEVASLKNYARVLEEQLAQRPSLHHASSNHLLFLIDSTEPKTPSRENSQHTAESGSASSIKSFQSALEKQQRLPQRSRNSPEMESLKRKLSTTRRPETANRNLLPELNQYKQNNVALQKQIESLMAKLNESKKNERALKTSLEEAERRCVDWQEKAEDADRLVKSASALQNTIDHLESRLEIANIERLDAEEQLFNLQAKRSPFDMRLPKLQVPSAVDRGNTMDKHLSMNTVFSSGSPTSPENESQEPSTLAAFITHIERLQDQVRQKDVQISELEKDREQLHERHGQLEREQRANTLQMDIQNQLLQKTRRTDAHIEQLRTAIIDREAIISEKEKSMRAIERQLEQHKLLLQAEIRRHAAMTLHSTVETDPLPELSMLAAKADIDRWIARLQERLKRAKGTSKGKEHLDPSEMQAQDLRQEIDFYVREIIYYKLDIRGYKSDIKKLKRITAQLSSYGSRASDLESDSSSLRPAVTPSRTRFATTSPEIGAMNGPSPVMSDPPYAAIPVNRPVTPPSSTSASASGLTPVDRAKAAETRRGVLQQLSMEVPMTPQMPNLKAGFNLANENDHIDTNISPRNIAGFSPEQRQLTPPSLDHEESADLLTTFPLGTPATPRRHGRSISESMVTSPALLPGLSSEEAVTRCVNKVGDRGIGRSASLSSPSKGRATPERPPRPQFGLFESPTAGRTIFSSPRSRPCVDVPAEALQHSPNQQTSVQRSPISRNVSNASSVRIAPPLVGKAIRDTGISSPSPLPPTVPRSRSGSAGSSIANPPVQPSSPSERKLSNASNSSVPFVIAMGSPHNPALIAPTAQTPPTSCSITRYAPLKIIPTTSRTGVGGTMASSTPVTSPISPIVISDLEPPLRPATTKPTATTPTTILPSRKLSLSRKQDEQVPRQPRTPSHSRNASGSSIRTAIRLPKAREKESDAHKVRKDSISMPRPLGSPFDVDRSMSVGAYGRREGPESNGVGEAN